MLHQTCFIFCTSMLLVMVMANPLEGRDIRRNVDETEYDPESIAAALAFLQELERRHGFDARPR